MENQKKYGPGLTCWLLVGNEGVETNMEATVLLGFYGGYYMDPLLHSLLTATKLWEES